MTSEPIDKPRANTLRELIGGKSPIDKEECKCGYKFQHRVLKDGAPLLNYKHHVCKECKCEGSMNCETCASSYTYLPEGDLKRQIHILREEGVEWRKDLCNVLMEIGLLCGNIDSDWKRCEKLVEGLRKKHT